MLVLSNSAAPAKSLLPILMRARTRRVSAAALLRGNWDSIRATTSSDGRTPPRVMVRRLSRAFVSAGVCRRVRQLAVMNDGSEPPITMARPTIMRRNRCLLNFENTRPPEGRCRVSGNRCQVQNLNPRLATDLETDTLKPTPDTRHLTPMLEPLLPDTSCQVWRHRLPRACSPTRGENSRNAVQLRASHAFRTFRASAQYRPETGHIDRGASDPRSPGSLYRV